MVLSKLRTTAIALFGLVFLAVGFGAVTRVGAEDSKEKAAPLGLEAVAPDFTRSLPPSSVPLDRSDVPLVLSLQDAIRTGLRNSGTIQVIQQVSDGTSPGRFVIARVARDVDAQRFKTEVTGQARSIEQQYWSLAHQYVELWGREKAVEWTREILKREQAMLEAGRGTNADVDEADHRLKLFERGLVKQTSDVITTERQLYKILGLSQARSSRILPATKMVEAQIQPDWNECLSAMLANQPDVVQAKAKVKASEASPIDSGELERERHRDFLQQVIRQTTQTLSRCFSEVDTNYKQFKAASRLRAAAAQRLESLRAYYEKGRIPIDRYLDALSEWASSIADESQGRTAYNISLMALEEAKGTLLEHDQITVVDPPKPIPATAYKGEGAAKVAPTKPDADGKTFSFQMTVGIGPKPVEIRGSFTIAPVPTRP